MSRAPVDVANPSPPEHDEHDDEEMPRVQMTRRRFVAGVLLIIGVVALLYYGLPRIAGLGLELLLQQRLEFVDFSNFDSRSGVTLK